MVSMQGALVPFLRLIQITQSMHYLRQIITLSVLVSGVQSIRDLIAEAQDQQSSKLKLKTRIMQPLLMTAYD